MLRCSGSLNFSSFKNKAYILKKKTARNSGNPQLATSVPSHSCVLFLGFLLGIARTCWAGKDFLEQILGFVFSAWAPLVDVGIAAPGWLVIHKMRQVSPVKSASPLHNVWKKLLQQTGERVRRTIASTCTKRSVCLSPTRCCNLRNTKMPVRSTQMLSLLLCMAKVLHVIEIPSVNQFRDLSVQASVSWKS